MMRLFVFLSLVLTCLLYGLVFDSIINSMAAGQYCSLLSQNPCLIPQQVDRWFSIVTLLFVVPASCIALLHWIVNSQKRLSTLFGWFIVVP